MQKRKNEVFDTMSISCDCCSLYMQKCLKLIMYKYIVSNLTSHISWPLPSFPVMARNASEMPRSCTFVTANSATTSCSQHYTAFKGFQRFIQYQRIITSLSHVPRTNSVFTMRHKYFVFVFMRTAQGERVWVLLKMQK